MNWNRIPDDLEWCSILTGTMFQMIWNSGLVDMEQNNRLVS